MTTLPVRNSVNHAPLRRGVLLIALAWFALSPTAQAVTPAPDGGYPNNNTAEGDSALFSLTSGTDNTAIGYQALYSNTTGVFNTAEGYQALYSNTYNPNSGQVGIANTANGYQALYSNTSGFYNTANGYQALFGNTTGNYNMANGAYALTANTTGTNNTANGVSALQDNASGGNNTADGEGALAMNISGSDNTATGWDALVSNTASNNTANGDQALFGNTSGGNNTANGAGALKNNSTGSNNIALGFGAGENLDTGDNNIDIGNVGNAGEANHIRIGTKGTQKNTFIAGISGVTVAGGVGVIVGANGHLGTVVSSARFKDEIKPMDKASEAILALKPVTFHYKHELDPEGIPQFGLVAEEVEKVNPDLVARDAEGKVFTVRYEAVNAMLLNEFLKEHKKVEGLEATAARQQKEIETLTAGLQKVSDKVELKQPAPQMVANNQ